jgi:preprotein translocase subunit SecD
VKRSRGLWISVIFVAILVLGSAFSFAFGVFKPVLGLDLEGGLAVILSAPAGTDQGTMNQALENIRNRVDAFGVGEPEIFLSGNTIEIQIPGLSNSTVQQQSTDTYCIEDPNGDSYGCSADQSNAQEALSGFSVGSQPRQVCLLDGNGDQLQCYASQQEADTAKGGITVAPKQGATPSASAPASASASPMASGASSPTVGPPPGASGYCLTDLGNTELKCYPSRADAAAAQKGMTSKVTKTSWCIQAPTSSSPSATPTPSASASPSASPSKKAKGSSSPSASASLAPATAYAKLDVSGAQPLPCDFASNQAAQTALAAYTTPHVTTQYCVYSSQHENLGCSTTPTAAAQRQRETGQQALLNLIGKTARLEERPTLGVVAPTDPSYASIQLTCSTPQEQATKDCQSAAQDNNDVWYLSNAAGSAPGSKMHLGPVVIIGSNITKASAQLTGGTQTDPITQWAVAFTLDGPGSSAFAKATTAAAPTHSQIAIAVDRTVISNPQVQSAITAGNGIITGNFTEQEAKDLASLLNAGALPVELTRQSVRTVSPTLGSESLKQGIIAGVAGLILLFIYLLLYYRLLGIVAWFGMSIWAILAFALISIAGKSFGYTLSLAGVAGLVISLGVTADSYIVFFERLKDEVRAGRSPRAAVQPAFKRAFRTIVAADIVTGIAAAVLYLTAVSSVRGFALTLGVATALDLFVVYFFKRPTVFLISKTTRLVEMRGFGLTSATAADHTALDTTLEPDA